MKIIDNASKYNLPPRFALLNGTDGSLHVYASEKGLAIGVRYAVRTSRSICALTVFKYTGCAWSIVESMDFLGNCYSVPDYEVSRFVDVLHVLCKLSCAYRTEDATAEDAPAEDAPAEDAPAEDAPAEDAPAEDAPAEDAPGVARSYRRKVSCAGNPATAVACVVFFSGGSSYVRAYQSRTRAYSGFHRYIFTGSSSAFLLYRTLGGWAMMNCVINRLDPVPYTDTLALKDRAIRLACEHFGGV